MPLQATSGAASYDAFGGGVAAVPQYIEDVFSTWLYTGNGSTQTINNGIDLAGKGGMVWNKIRSGSASYGGSISDTSRGTNSQLFPNSSNGASGNTNAVTSFNNSGFSLGAYVVSNLNAGEFASWTFRKQPKFFDVVTWTGNETVRNIAHNLGSVPGCIIVKNFSNNGFDWLVWHRSGTQQNRFAAYLNLSDAYSDQGSSIWGTPISNPPNMTSTTFSVGTSNLVNQNGNQYVAYVFAHNAGGFGLTGTDNVISCGSFTTDGSGSATVSLGYEPQWLLVKNTQLSENWVQLDNMRGWSFASQQRLFPNLSNAEQSLTGNYGTPTATGFNFVNGLGNSNTYIYIAIRRPMKVPTTGTSVFESVVRAGTSTATTVSTSFPVDMSMIRTRTGKGTFNTYDRLRGAPFNLRTSATNAEFNATGTVLGFDTPNGIRLGSDVDLNWVNTSGQNYVNYLFRRAPGFFDAVCYTGTGFAMTINHNLGVAPEMAIIKNRVNTQNWAAWHKSFSPASSISQAFNGARSTGFIGTRTATTFAFLTGNAITSAAGENYVAYFFATVPGVSMVGSYTGTGTTQQINCGFTAGARFVLIARADVGFDGPGGPYYVWDTARGITSGNDPFMTLGQFTNEDTSTDYIDPFSAGFEISSSAPVQINASGVPYIFLAIA